MLYIPILSFIHYIMKDQPTLLHFVLRISNLASISPITPDLHPTYTSTLSYPQATLVVTNRTNYLIYRAAYFLCSAQWLFFLHLLSLKTLVLRHFALSASASVTHSNNRHYSAFGTALHICVLCKA